MRPLPTLLLLAACEWVEAEVRAAGALFERGPVHLVARGTEADDGPTFIVEDGPYVSGRWPGDAWRLARVFRDRVLGAAA